MSEPDRANLSLSWRSIAIGAMVVAIGALTLAAVVDTIKKADTLSVVALAVAIVAFVVQILVFIVQAAASAQQELRGQELYGSTMRVLATIEEKAEGTRREVTTINEKLLAAILGKAIPEVDASSSKDFAGDVARIAARATEQIAGRLPSVQEGSDTTRESLIDSFPTAEEIEKIEGKVRDLPEEAIPSLAALGVDFANYEKSGFLKPGLELSEIRSLPLLIERGLIAVDPQGWASKPVHVLTPDGVLVARFLLGKDAPNDLPDAFVNYREMASKFNRNRR